MFVLGILFFALMCITGIYSLNNDIKETENTLSTSAVDIDLKEYNSNDELFSEDGKMVMPGEEVSLIPRVYNLGIDCYIRAKITYTLEGRTFDITNYIEGNYTSWNKKGEYYYYDSVLNKNDSVDLFNKVSIPDVITSNDQGKKIVINIVVDAIQQKNFDGNWEGKVIQKSINKSYDINDHGHSEIIYENNSKSHILMDDGFFDNLGGLLPGDTAVEKFTILNSSKNKNRYYLKIENTLSDAEKELLNEFKLIIKDNKNNIVFKGSINSTSKILLGTYGPGEKGIYTIELSLPTTADNRVSKFLTKIGWIFSLEVVENGENETIISPKTKDAIDIYMIMFMLSSLGFLTVLFYARKEKNKNIEMEGNNRE